MEEHILEVKDFKDAQQKAILAQQNLDFTESNVNEYGIDSDALTLLFENDNYWLIRHNDFCGEWINLVYKENYDMEVIEVC